MGTPTIPSGGTGGERWGPPPYSVENHICLSIPNKNARQFVIEPFAEPLVMCAILKERETAFAG